MVDSQVVNSRLRLLLLLPCLLFVLIHAGCGKSAKDNAADKRAKLYPNAPLDDEAVTSKPAAGASDFVAAGTEITVELSEVIDSDASPTGSFIPVWVTADVKGKDGKVAIPARSSGIVVVTDAARSEGNSLLRLALYQLTIGDKSYLLNHQGSPIARLELREEASKGAGHRSVHLGRLELLKFTLSEGISFKL